MTTSAPTLTTAELWLPPLLSTHLTFRDMSERLYIAPNHGQVPGDVGLPQLAVSSHIRAIQRMQQTCLLGA